MTPAESLAAKKRKKHKAKRPPRSPRKHPFRCDLRDRRIELGLNIRDVAKGIGMSHAGYYEIERGSDPQLSTAMRIAAFYGAEVKDCWSKLT